MAAPDAEGAAEAVRCRPPRGGGDPQVARQGQQEEAGHARARGGRAVCALAARGRGGGRERRVSKVLRQTPRWQAAANSGGTAGASPGPAHQAV